VGRVRCAHLHLSIGLLVCRAADTYYGKVSVTVVYSIEWYYYIVLSSSILLSEFQLSSANTIMYRNQLC